MRKYNIGIIYQNKKYIYSYVDLLLLIFCFPFIPFRNLDEVFTYNNMAQISLRNHFLVMSSMVLTKSDHLIIHNYVRSLLNSILIHILMVWTRLEPVTYCS